MEFIQAFLLLIVSMPIVYLVVKFWKIRRESGSPTTRLKPNGMPAKDMCPVILLSTWAKYLDAQYKEHSADKKMIFAGMGKPSYMLNVDLAQAASVYWQRYADQVVRFKDELSQQQLTSEQMTDVIAQKAAVIDYGYIEGNPDARAMMAQGLTSWYGTNLNIKPENILFTVGGVSALRMIFRMINENSNYGRIITPIPYYPFYNHPGHKNNLHGINLMKEPGYRLTAAALEDAINEAHKLSLKDGKKIGAFLFCDPNNPLGSAVGEQEWKKIAEVLKRTDATIPIILDEAYAEMMFDGKKHSSLLAVAPELKDRILLLRSATKAFSASGERMAVLLGFNQQWLEQLKDETSLAYLHVPESIQFAYAQAIKNISTEYLCDLSSYYQLQVEYVLKKLKTLNLYLPDVSYSVDGTFYVIANLGKLIGSKMPQEACQAIGAKSVIQTDEDICYALLFQDRVMLMPMSYCGVDPKLGYVRITCGGGISQLKELLDRLANRINSLSDKCIKTN